MGRFRDAARAAADLTNKELASRIAELTPVSAAQLQQLLPTKRDKEDFVALMRVVEEETSVENQLNFLRDNLATAGRVALKALKLFVLGEKQGVGSDVVSPSTPHCLLLTSRFYCLLLTSDCRLPA
jgi:hypothetical protein